MDRSVEMGFEPARLIDRLEAFPGLLSALLGERGGGVDLATRRGRVGSGRDTRSPAAGGARGFPPPSASDAGFARIALAPDRPRGAVIAGRDIEGDPAGMLGQFIHEPPSERRLAARAGRGGLGAVVPAPHDRGDPRGDLLAAWADHDSLHARQIISRRHQRTELDAGGYSCRYAGEWTA